MSLRAPVFVVHVGSVARSPGGGGGGASRAGCRCPRPPPQKIPDHSGDDGQDNDEPQPACAPIGCPGCRRGGGSGLRESFVQRNERRSRRDLERLEHDGRPFAILTADSGQVMRSAEEARLEGRASRYPQRVRSVEPVVPVPRTLRSSSTSTSVLRTVSETV